MAFVPAAGAMPALVVRTSSGNTDYVAAAGGVHVAIFQPGADGLVTVWVLVDECSVEVFGGEGQVVISVVIFASEDSAGLSRSAIGGDVEL
ncbi:hypothetical protein F5Y18DRAFT_409590 [Xylariaceae sp. FL1019]|nr:hypothetical protein F5Y18DRAFT_409590 [Xylariaceae sp. FL1019]